MDGVRVHTPSNPEFSDRVIEYEKEITFDIRATSGDPEEDLRTQLDEQLSSIFAQFSPKDFVRVSFQAGTMTYPASTRFDHYNNMDLRDITTYIQQMDQSGKLQIGQETIPVSVTFIHNPSGSGRIGDHFIRNPADLQDYVNSLKSVVDVMAKDGNCFARAVIYLIYLNEYCTNKEEKDALRAFARHVKSHNNVSTNEVRRAASEKLNSMLDEFINEADLERGEPVSSESYAKVAEVLKHPNEWRKVSYRLVIADVRRQPFFKSGGRHRQAINLLYQPGIGNGHYSAITKAGAFFSQARNPEHYLGKDFCDSCEMSCNRHKHTCSSTCIHCRQLAMDPVCAADAVVSCRHCKNEYPNELCLRQHRANGACVKKELCKTCKRVYRNKKHVCYTKKCSRCNIENARDNHECYVRGLNMDRIGKDDSAVTFFCFFDTETAQIPKKRADGSVVEKHIAVMAYVQVVCNVCWTSTANEETNPEIDCQYCLRQKRLFTNDDDVRSCIELLLDFLSDGVTAHCLEKRFMPKQILVFAHNLKRFDGQLMLEAASARGDTINPLITNGLSIMAATVKGRFKFVDSINFLQLPCSKLPQAYGFSVKKSVFPHRATYRAYVNGWDGSWPSLNDFYADRLTPNERNELQKWYDSQDRTQPFDFWNIMKEYIVDDVRVLMLASMRFREAYIEQIGTDPYSRNITLAGAVIEGLRVTQLPEYLTYDQPLGLPITPYHSYDPKGKVSMKSRIWLLFLKKRLYPDLLFEYEDMSNHMRYDGFCPTTKTVFEFDGCLWHCCPTCYGPGRKQTALAGNVMVNMRKRALRHAEKNKRLSATGYTIVSIWEHEYDELLKSNDEFLNHYKDVKDGVRLALGSQDLDIREALFGGRVEAIRMYAEAGRGRLMMKDINSLYPYCLYEKRFAGCHPTFIFNDFDYTLESYFGLVHCTVLAPRQLLFGALPLKSGGKLTFPLCGSCVDKRNEGSCRHTDGEREMTALWTTFELENAVNAGYKITDIQVVMHHARTMKKETNPVSSYMLMLLKNKIKNSGRGNKTDAELAAFLQELEEIYGITLAADEVTDNPGARMLAKLFMNSVWGRLGIRTDRSNTEMVTTYKQLLNMMTDQTIEVTDVLLVGSELRVTYTGKQDFIKTPEYSSLMTAVMTTSWGRVELYKYMAVLGPRLLYADTDSVIYSLEEGEEDPVPTGQHLGDMADELVKYGSGARLVEFVSGGPKTYALRITDGEKETHVVKHKGIRINNDVYQKLSFDTMKYAVRKYCLNADPRRQLKDMRSVLLSRTNDKALIKEIDDALQQINPPITVDQYMITANRFFELESKVIKKDWRIVSDKRRLIANGFSVPYGFTDDIDMPQEPASLPDPEILHWVRESRGLQPGQLLDWRELEPGGTISETTLFKIMEIIKLRNERYGLKIRIATVKSVEEFKDSWHLLNNDAGFDYVFVMNHSQKRGWGLFVFDRRCMTIKYYSPMYKEKRGRTWVIQDPFDELRCLREHGNFTFYYACICVRGLPRMSRSDDSGVFMLLYADLLSLGLSEEIPRLATQERVSAYRARLYNQKDDIGYFSLCANDRTYTVRLPY